MSNDRSGQRGKARPSHRLCVQHSEDSKYTTEIGALWPHSKGGGFSITIKAGIFVGNFAGARLVAFEIDHEAEERRADERMHERDDRRNGSRR